MGRKPTPLHILKIRGSSSLRKRRNRGKEEPKPPDGRPEDPPLPQYAADIYRSTLTLLERVPGLVTSIDGGQIERYSRFLVRWRHLESESEKMIASAGGNPSVVLADPANRVALRALWAESRRLDQAMKEIECNYGMSPAARRGLAVEYKQPVHLPQRVKPA